MHKYSNIIILSLIFLFIALFTGILLPKEEWLNCFIFITLCVIVNSIPMVISILNNKQKKNMNKIVINGKTYSGNSVIVSNGKVIVNGQDVTPDSKNIRIDVTGDIEKLQVDSCDKIYVNGNVTNIKTQSGDVDIAGNVLGSISTMSGDVDCGEVNGNINTMSGNIKHKK